MENFYSYKNSDGETIPVSKEHLEVAVRIKEELQKASPSRRCSWFKHKQMMLEEGYEDSDVNENYRVLVKYYQKRKGTLPTAKQVADVHDKNTLQSIKNEIGNLNSAKLDMQDQGRKIRKLVRDTNKDMIFIEEVGDAIRGTQFIECKNPVVLPDWESEKDTDMIVCLSDIHYGSHVDIAENYYDTDVARNLVLRYASKIIEQIKLNHVNRVDIVNLGDIVEHAYMRNQNLFDSEETLSEQVVHVTQIIIEFIQAIRNHVELITYRAIAGNHDRLQGDKNSNLNADHAVRVSNAIIKMWIQTAGSDLDFVETDDYFASIDRRGYHFAFVHGDRDNLNNKNTLAKLSELHDTHFDAVLGGHVHHWTMQEVGMNRYQATFGSIKGIDDYSMRLGAKSSRSQGFILIDNDGFDIRKMSL